MTVQELIDLFRLHTQDIELPGSGDDSYSLFKNAEIIEYFSESQQEFARQTNFQFFSKTNKLKYKADNPWIAVDPNIMSFQRASLSGKKIGILTHRDLDDNYKWEERTGEPTDIIIDLEQEFVRVFPIPTAAGTIDVKVELFPEELTSVTDTPEIPEKYHRKLLHYALFLGLSKQDADSFDPQAADRQMLLHEKALDDARREIGRRFKKPRVVRYGGL